MSDIATRTQNIQKKAKGTGDYINSVDITSSDPSWIGSVKALTAALKKLSEVASNIKNPTDIHFTNYAAILSEGVEMMILVDSVIRDAFKKSFLNRNPKRKKEVSWASNLIIYYTQLLSYITDPKVLPTFELDKLFGVDTDGLKLARSIWGKETLVDPSHLNKIDPKCRPKKSPKSDDLVESEVVSPILLAAIFGPGAELKSLKSYEGLFYCYKKVEDVRADVIEYKPEDDSKYFYIVSKKFEDKKIDGKELSNFFCLTPESKPFYYHLPFIFIY